LNNAVVKDLQESSERFIKLIQPELKELLKGDFTVVEGVTIEEMSKLLDTLAGIDVWHIDKIRGIRGIASRIQPSGYNWHTFTIRHERQSGATTEYEKRKHAIQKEYLYPYLTVQAYTTKLGDKLIAYAIARTKDIIEMIDNGWCKKNKTGKNQIGQASFFVINWDDMKDKGYKIIAKEYS
jgi:hypothetical protein